MNPMKKKPKLKKPNLQIKRPFRRKGKVTEERVNDAFSNVPRITNETVTEHREEVLSSARKYIYPLQQSKHRVVRVSIALLVTVVVAFLAYCGLALYKFQSTSGFMYDVVRVLPFPVAKAGPSWVGYESYLFELRRNMHYYRTQQQANFSTKDGKVQLARLKQQAMHQVIEDTYTKQLAEKNGVVVSDEAVSNEVTLVRSQNRLGTNDRVFKEVLNEFWGWNEADFRRELKQQLLQQAVVSKLDTGTHDRADAALKQLQGGADFGTLATKVSEDPNTKATGGQYPAPLTHTDRNTAPAVTAELFKLKPGQVSPIINTGYTLDILKVLEATGTARRAAHIQFNFEDITTYTKPLETTQPPHTYIHV